MDQTAPSGNSNQPENPPAVAQSNVTETEKTEKIPGPSLSKVSEIFNQLSLAIQTIDPKIEDEEEILSLLKTRLSHRNIIQDVSKDLAPTDMIRLQNMPKHYDIRCELWVKCEFQHHGGSSKIRTALVMLEKLRRCGRFKPSETTLITHTSTTFAFALALANRMNRDKYEIVAVLPDRASKIKVSLLQHLDVKIFRSPEESSHDRMSKESPATMAEFLTTKIRNAYVLDPFQDSMSVDTHFWWTGEEIVKQFQERIDMLVCGYETGGLISGISPVIKEVNKECIVIGVDLSGEVGDRSLGEDKSKNRNDTCSIEEFSSPNLSKVIDRTVADKWYAVPWKEAFCKARQLLLMEGIPASPSAGAVLHATLEAIKHFGLASNKDKRIVLIFDNSAMYTDFEYGSNDWMVGHGYLTHEDIESRVWFHKIHTWRIPVKVPVTVYDDFNAYAVYSMMNSENVNRVVVCDVASKSIVGIASLPLLNKNIDAGLITRVTLIGNSYCICRSFQTISIHENLSSLLELLKTHSYAILVQRQKISSATNHMEQEWLAGILDAEDVIRFLVDLEQCHAKKFGAVLAGGFQTVDVWKGNKIQEGKNIFDELSSKTLIKPSLDDVAKTIAPNFASPIVMNAGVDIHEGHKDSTNPSESNGPSHTNNPSSLNPSEGSPEVVRDEAGRKTPLEATPDGSTSNAPGTVQPTNEPPVFRSSVSRLKTESRDPITPSAPFSPAASEFFYEPATPTRAPASSAVFQDAPSPSALVPSDSTVQLDLAIDSSSTIQIELNSELSSSDNSDQDLQEDTSALSVSESIFRAMYSSEQVQYGGVAEVISNMFLSPNSSNEMSHASSSNFLGAPSSFFPLPVSIPGNNCPFGCPENESPAVLLTSSTRAEEEDLRANISGATSGEAPPVPSTSPKVNSNGGQHMEKALNESSSKPYDSSK